MEGHKYRTHTRQVATVHNVVKQLFEGAFLFFVCLLFNIKLVLTTFILYHKTIKVVEIYFENEGKYSGTVIK